MPHFGVGDSAIEVSVPPTGDQPSGSTTGDQPGGGGSVAGKTSPSGFRSGQVTGRGQEKPIVQLTGVALLGLAHMWVRSRDGATYRRKDDVVAEYRTLKFFLDSRELSKD